MANRYMIGDVVEFMAGGVGVVRDVVQARHGRLVAYATQRIDALAYHPREINAWHLDDDFSCLVSGSGVRYLSPELFALYREGYAKEVSLPNDPR